MATPALPLRAARPITPAGALARRALSLLVVHGILLAGAVFILLPFVWMLITSIKSPSEIFAVDFSLWPKQFSGAENYGRALDYSKADEDKADAIAAKHWATADEDKQQQLASPRLEMRKFLGTTYIREVTLRPPG